MSLTVASIEVRDIGGIEHFSATLNQINIITGENGTGKTTLLNAIESVFAGGHDPDLIRHGAEKGIVIIGLSDGTKITKVIKARESELDILTPDGGKKRAPATYLRELAAGIAFDPLQFLEAEPKQQAKFLLEKIPLSFSADEINGAVGFAFAPLPTLGLTQFNELRDGQYTQRTEISRKFRDIEGIVNQMGLALPNDDESDWAAIRDERQRQVATLDEQMDTIGYQVESALRLKDSELKAELDAAVAAAKEGYAKKSADARDRTTKMKANESAKIEKTRALISIELGEARQKAEQQARASGVRESIAQNQEELRKMNAEEMRLTRTIKALDELKHRKLRELPVAGLDVRIEKGQPVILVDEIPLEKINRQQQIFVAIQIAVAAGLGRLPLMICEAAELSDVYLAELSKAATDAGLQLVLARWRNGTPLTMEAA